MNIIAFTLHINFVVCQDSIVYTHPLMEQSHKPTSVNIVLKVCTARTLSLIRSIIYASTSHRWRRLVRLSGNIIGIIPLGYTSCVAGSVYR